MAPNSKDKEKEKTCQCINDSVIDQLIEKISTNKTLLASIHETVKEAIRSELSQLHETIERQESRIMDLENSMEKTSKAVADMSTKLERKDEEISYLRKACNDLEQYSRRNCVRIFGIPEQSTENTTETVCNLVKDKLGINLQKSQIDRSHRVGNPESKKPVERSEGRGRSER